MLCWRFIFWSLLLICFYPRETQGAWKFSHKLDVQVRSDSRSDRDHRSQYRLRYYPQLAVDKNWSFNSFVVTGDAFNSSHNSIFDGSSQRLYPRRLYMRHEDDSGKTEFGVIPTYKGRVSSTGLSKDGWISGIRQVFKRSNGGALEIVVGQLQEQDPGNALQLADNIDYFELEYSGRISEEAGFEVSLERMTGGNFLRSEYRYAWNSNHEVFIEWIQRLDKPRNKALGGFAGEVNLSGYPMSYFAYISHVDDELGFRAELTEDFLGYGRGFSGEIGGGFSVLPDTEWFIRFDAVDSTERLLAGIKWSL